MKCGPVFKCYLNTRQPDHLNTKLFEIRTSKSLVFKSYRYPHCIVNLRFECFQVSAMKCGPIFKCYLNIGQPDHFNTKPFEIRTSKSLVFKSYRYSDPHCIVNLRFECFQVSAMKCGPVFKCYLNTGQPDHLNTKPFEI